MATDHDDEYGLKSIRILIEGESSKPNHSKQSDVTICMVPDSLRNLNPGAYTPRVTSIGPLHKQDERLRAMEELKVTYMYRLFCETAKSTNKDMKQITSTCVKAVLELIAQARACYAPSLTNYDDLKLAEMMVIDGCFILELLYRSEHGIMAGDPIFDNILVNRDVKYDLLLLENQIPFFILEKLFQVTVKHILEFNLLPDLSLTDLLTDLGLLRNFEGMNILNSDLSLTNLVLRYFEDMNILNSSDLSLTNLVLRYFEDIKILNNSDLALENGRFKHCHILGLLQSCYRPGAINRGKAPTIRYSATEIAGAGIAFKPQTKSYSQLAVEFKKSSLIPGLAELVPGEKKFKIPVLRFRETSFNIPVLRIEDSTPSFLRNLIAYEQCYPLSRHYVTSFAFLMDMLIDTNDDVSLLVSAKVLLHNLGACEDVKNLFNSICNGVVRRDFYYSDEWTKLDDYRKSSLPKILSSLSHLYKSTTWKTLTVIAAMAIFALTLLQTIYDVRNP